MPRKLSLPDDFFLLENFKMATHILYGVSISEHDLVNLYKLVEFNSFLG